MKIPKMFHERVSKKRRKFNLNRVVNWQRVDTQDRIETTQ